MSATLSLARTVCCYVLNVFEVATYYVPYSNRRESRRCLSEDNVAEGTQPLCVLTITDIMLQLPTWCTDVERPHNPIIHACLLSTRFVIWGRVTKLTRLEERNVEWNVLVTHMPVKISKMARS